MSGRVPICLISFWYTTVDNAKAGNKAFIVNRVGDLGFSLGMMLIWSIFGTLSFRTPQGTGVLDLASKLGANGLHYAAVDVIGHPVPALMITAICFLLFVGAMGKSAQIPLWVWLPDAMAGPTPVSALIHAATMVTAGVVMLTRCSFLFVQSPDALHVRRLDWHSDRVCRRNRRAGAAGHQARSGLFDRLAIRLYVPRLRRWQFFCGDVSRHDSRFFQSLLFMGSGAVIHSMLGEQDMRKMGGLRKLIPKTHLMMLIGTIAIAGIPPLSGFWSKDEILDYALRAPWGGEISGKVLYGMGLFTAFMTAFYMWRMMSKTFYTDPRFVNGELEAHHHSNFDDEHDTEGHHTGQEEATTGAAVHNAQATDNGHGHGSGTVHESPNAMLVPLYVLALFSLFFGLAVGPNHAFENFLEPSVAPLSRGAVQWSEEGLPQYIGYAISTVVAFAGIGLAYFLYSKNKKTGQIIPIETEQKWERSPTSPQAFIYDTFYSKWGFDAVYNFVFIKLGGVFATILWKFVDSFLIDGMITGLGYLVGGVSKGTRRIQTGLVRNYALVMLFGVVALVTSILFTWNHLNFK